MGQMRFLALIVFASLLLIPGITTNALAVLIGGVEFPDGAISFADSVINYDNTLGGSAPTDPNFLDPAALLLAGAQTNALWIMSALAVIGSVAFGAIYITSKKN